MNRTLTAALAGFVTTATLVATAASARAGRDAPPAPAVAAPAEIRAKVAEVVAPLQTHHVFDGVVLVAKGDDVLLNAAFGKANHEFDVAMTPEARFPIASITKAFTGVILRRLEQEKKLSLSDPLAKWVPDFPSADRITLDHLRTHRSGVRDPEALRGRIRVNLTTAEVVDHLKKTPLASAPGGTSSYTTANYAILAHVIERVTGQPFREVIAHYVYGPAGMRDSGELTSTTVVPRLVSGYMPDVFGRGLAVCGPEDTSWKAGGGSSYSAAADLHRFLRAFYAGKLLPGVDPLSIVSLQRSHGRRVTRATGAFPGANSHLAYYPDQGLAVVVLSNNYAPVTGLIADAAAAIAFGEKVVVPAVELAKDAPPADPKLAGRYRVEGIPNPMTIELRQGRPIVTWTPVRQSALLPTAAGSWFMPFDWATLTFTKGEGGDYATGTLTAPWADAPRKVERIEERPATATPAPGAGR